MKLAAIIISLVLTSFSAFADVSVRGYTRQDGTMSSPIIVATQTAILITTGQPKGTQIRILAEKAHKSLSKIMGWVTGIKI